MNSKAMRRLNWIAGLMSLSFSLSAQTWEEQPGEIEEAEVVIEKNIEIELPFAARNFEKIPPQPVAIKPGPLNYSFISSLPRIQPVSPRLRVVTINDEEIKKLYGGYLKAGFGNYASPLLDAYLYSKRNEKFSLGAYGNYHASFRGPVDKENSAASDLNLGVTGSLHGDDANLNSEISYTRLGRHFYGYQEGLTVDPDTIQQIINRFKADLTLNGELTTTPWIYSLGASYRFTEDDYEASENEFSLDGSLGYKMSEDSKINLSAEYTYFGRNDALITGLNRNLLVIKPSYEFLFNRIKLRAGLNMTFENDTIKGLDKFHVYPDIRASLDLSDAFILYGGVQGNIQKRSLDYWLNENPFLAPNVSVFHANKSLEIYGGLTGQLANSLGLQLGGSVSSIKNMSYILNDSLDVAIFTLAYDSLKTTVVNVFGGLSFQKEKTKIWLRADYRAYNTGAIAEAWHRPAFELSAGTKFNVYDKILLSGNFKSLFGIKAYDPVNQSSIDLDAIPILNLQAEYLLSGRAGIFVQANNIFSTENVRFYRYPNRGIQIIAGITLSF